MAKLIEENSRLSPNEIGRLQPEMAELVIGERCVPTGEYAHMGRLGHEAAIARRTTSDRKVLNILACNNCKSLFYHEEVHVQLGGTIRSYQCCKITRIPGTHVR